MNAAPFAIVALLVAPLALVFGSTPAEAAPTPLSAIPLTRAELHPAQGTMRFVDVHPDDDGFVAAMDAPVCLRTDEDGVGARRVWIPADAWLHTNGMPWVVVERLITGPDPALELTRFDRTSASATSAPITGRARIALVPVGDGEVPAFAYRTKDAVHILVPQGFNSAFEAFGTPFGDHPQCGFAHLVLSGKEASVVRNVTMAHPLPGWARWMTAEQAFEPRKASQPLPVFPTFTVNASVSKVSRDPEPLVSLAVRALPSAETVTLAR